MEDDHKWMIYHAYNDVIGEYDVQIKEKEKELERYYKKKYRYEIEQKLIEDNIGALEKYITVLEEGKKQIKEKQDDLSPVEFE